MKPARLGLWVGAGLALCMGSVLAAPMQTLLRPPGPPTGLAAGPTPTPEEARRMVAMLDDAYQEFLHEIHRAYPVRTGQPIVAATIVRKVQERMTELGWPASHFLGVNAILMNPDHRPSDAFEKRAVSVLGNGPERLEALEPGKLRVATVVPVGGGCGSCHWTNSTLGARAAITWTVPVRQ